MLALCDIREVVSMKANRTLLQMKYARIIEEIAGMGHVSADEAMDMFYNSQTFQLISEGVADMHCLSDKYLAEEVLREQK